jgi:hypothetical protein
MSSDGVWAVVGLVGIGAVVWWASNEGAQRLERWECARNVEADLVAIAPSDDHKVEKCTGDQKAAMCFVVALDKGQRRTAPVTDWDCRDRHLPDSWLERISKGEAGVAEGLAYVSSRLNARQRLLDGDE